ASIKGVGRLIEAVALRGCCPSAPCPAFAQATTPQLCVSSSGADPPIRHLGKEGCPGDPRIRAVGGYRLVTWFTSLLLGAATPTHHCSCSMASMAGRRAFTHRIHRG